MSGHFPFLGKADRISVYAFYEKHRLSLDLQEQYYKWWYDWAKSYVMNDADLRHAKAVEFSHYPFGQHAHANFHLQDYAWSTSLLDLGKFIENSILTRLDQKQLHALEHEHAQMVHALEGQRQEKPRPAPPDVGRYRHI